MGCNRQRFGILLLQRALLRIPKAIDLRSDCVVKEGPDCTKE